jgi:hypothetical protein
LLGFGGKPAKPEDNKAQKVTDPLDGRPFFHPKILLKLALNPSIFGLLEVSSAIFMGLSKPKHLVE